MPAPRVSWAEVGNKRLLLEICQSVKDAGGTKFHATERITEVFNEKYGEGVCTNHAARAAIARYAGHIDLPPDRSGPARNPAAPTSRYRRSVDDPVQSAPSSRIVDGLIQADPDNVPAWMPKARPRPNRGRMKLAFACGDNQGWEMDVAACRVALNVAAYFQPDYVVHLGDLTDCYWASSFTRAPELYRAAHPDRDFDLALWFLNSLQAAVPEPEEYVYTPGNHEDRIKRTFAEYLPGYDESRWMRTNVETIMQLAKRGWTVPQYKVRGGPAWFPPECERGSEHPLMFFHGKSAGDSALLADFREHGVSVVRGHTNRCWTNHVTRTAGTLWGMIPGHLCERHPQWTRNSAAKQLGNWSQGVGLVHIHPDGSFRMEPIPILRDSKDRPWVSLGSGTYIGEEGPE